MLSAIGGILYSVYVIRDTQTIMTKYSADEYIDAFVCIYLDIVHIIPEQASSAASFAALAYFQCTTGLAQNWLWGWTAANDSNRDKDTVGVGRSQRYCRFLPKVSTSIIYYIVIMNCLY